MSLPQPDNPMYEDDKLLVLESIAALTDSAANDGGIQLGDEKNLDPEPGDPFYEDGPSGETLLEAIQEMSVDGIAKLLNFVLRKTYTRAKPRLQEHENNNGSRFGVRAKIALDITYVAYYGDRDKMDWVQSAPEDKGYDWYLIKRHHDDRAIILTANNDFAYDISREFIVLCITHQTKTDERTGILERFRTDDYSMLVTSQVLDEGTDVPAANVGIILSGSALKRQYAQRLDRILRPTDDRQPARPYEIITEDTMETYVSQRRREGVSASADG